MKNSTLLCIIGGGIAAGTLVATTVTATIDRKAIQHQLSEERKLAEVEMKKNGKLSAETQKRIYDLEQKLGKSSSKSIRKR